MNRAPRVYSLTLAALLLLAGHPAAAQSTIRVNDIAYASVAEQTLRLDLYLPRDVERPPLVVWLHGGAWQRGSKNDMPLTALVDHGFAIASIDFRSAANARFPAQAHDIKAAVRFLRAEADRYGYDASRIGVAGASSGGHLAALVGTTNRHDELEGDLGEHRDRSTDVHAIVSFFGASNLTTILRQSTPFGLRVREPALRVLLGDLPEQASTLAELASPVFHVDDEDPPLLLLHGDQDPQMPINQSHELEGAYRARGLDVHFEVVHGAAHGGDAFYDASRLKLVTDFLDRHLRAEPRSNEQEST